ncbi:MAG TPA: cytochrome C [Ignavibacteriaceae bacterium]|nr:cytochrome C [Ignavibacteriaceae bacterium]
MKLKYLYIVTFFSAFIFLMVTAFTADEGDDNKSGNENKIHFSHSLHKDIAECQQCHIQVTKSTSLKDRLMPNHESCQECHDTENSDECSKCHIDENYEALEQDVSKELIFNHSFHLTNAAAVCETCHKGISDVDYAEQAPHHDPSMENCYSCHSDNGKATISCEGCHTQTAGLLPQDHKSVSFLKSHKYKAEELNANCVMCHNNGNNSCESCHAATESLTEANGNSDFFQPYEPNNFVGDPKIQKITRVHDLNYRYFHGIDAKNQRLDCQSCHQLEVFCTSCHQSDESDFSMGGIVPATHLQQNFFTFGVGTGGGLHAELAKKEIESCVSCHDVQGADPTCVTCHLDSDGIKGTNPKTHRTGFMKDEEGDWHESQGSVCFNCHTGSPSNPPGVGFCGYCHGAK